jgi:hypothetical protein
MADLSYRARVRDGRLIELPPQADALDLQPGDEIKVVLLTEERGPGMRAAGADESTAVADFQARAELFFGEADSTRREPEAPTGDKAPIAKAIKEKHRVIGLKS